MIMHKHRLDFKSANEALLIRPAVVDGDIDERLVRRHITTMPNDISKKVSVHIQESNRHTTKREE